MPHTRADSRRHFIETIEKEEWSGLRLIRQYLINDCAHPDVSGLVPKLLQKTPEQPYPLIIGFRFITRFRVLWQGAGESAEMNEKRQHRTGIGRPVAQTSLILHGNGTAQVASKRRLAGAGVAEDNERGVAGNLVHHSHTLTRGQI